MNQSPADVRHLVSRGGGRHNNTENNNKIDSPPQRRSSRNSLERRTSPSRTSPNCRRSPKRQESRGPTSETPTRSSSLSKKSSRQHDKRNRSRRALPSRSRSELPKTKNEDKSLLRKAHSNSPRHKMIQSSRSADEYNESLSTFASSKSTVSRSISLDVGNTSQLRFDVDAPRDPLVLPADATSITTSSSQQDMTPEQKAWAGIANVLCHGDASVTSVSVSEVLPKQVLRALRDMRRNGSVVASIGTNPYALNDEDNHDMDDESKASESLHSSMPSLCDASISSLATSILSAYSPGRVNNQVFVKARPQDDKLQAFCSQLLGSAQQRDVVSASGDVDASDKEEMVSYLHHLLAGAYSNGDKPKPQPSTTKASLDDSMPSLLDCISHTESTGIDLHEDEIARSSVVPKQQEDELNSSMPSLQTCRTGDLDLLASYATKWASYGDFDHIVEDESSSPFSVEESSPDILVKQSSSNVSAYELHAALPTTGEQSYMKPLSKLSMRRSKTIDVSHSSPAIVKPTAMRRVKTESMSPIEVSDFDRDATPDTTFAELIPNVDNLSLKAFAIRNRKEQRISLPKLFSRRKESRPGSNVFNPKLPAQSFRQRVSLFKLRSYEPKSHIQTTKRNGRSEERFFPTEETRTEEGEDLLLP